jgi:hypothetical protein
MAKKSLAKQFNRTMDEVITRLVTGDIFSAEFRSQFIKGITYYRRVAEFDPELAVDILVNTLMVGRAMALWAAKGDQLKISAP